MMCHVNRLFAKDIHLTTYKNYTPHSTNLIQNMSSSDDDHSDEYSTNGGGGRSLPARRAASLGQNKRMRALKDEEMNLDVWTEKVNDDQIAASKLSRKRKFKDSSRARAKKPKLSRHRLFI